MQGLPKDILIKLEALQARNKKITINDVAALAGVSKKTVSRIINDSPSVSEETRNLVKAVMAKADYRPDPQARGLAFRKSFLIGLIYDNPNAQYVVNMQMGILDALKGTGRELVVHPCDRTASDWLSEIHSIIELQKLSGVIILPPIAENQDLIALLDSLDVPYVRVTAKRTDNEAVISKASHVVSLDAVGCAEAAKHLTQKGHARIGYIGGNLSYPSAHVRRAGFEEGLRAMDRYIVPRWDRGGDYTFDTGYRVAYDLLNTPDRPTAIIACNDEMAAGVYKACHELGLTIPNDLSVVSFDDSPLAARLSPGLNSVRLPIRDMGAVAASHLLDGAGRDKVSFFESVYIQRKSVATFGQDSD